MGLWNLNRLSPSWGVLGSPRTAENKPEAHDVGHRAAQAAQPSRRLAKQNCCHGCSAKCSDEASDENLKYWMFFFAHARSICRTGIQRENEVQKRNIYGEVRNTPVLRLVPVTKRWINTKSGNEIKGGGEGGTRDGQRTNRAKLKDVRKVNAEPHLHKKVGDMPENRLLDDRGRHLPLFTPCRRSTLQQ